MKSLLTASLFVFIAPTAMAFQEPVRWETYSIDDTRTSVDIPTSIFTERDGHPNGYGERLKTADGRAELTIQTAPNTDDETPATFLSKRHPPRSLQYKRVTSRFFAVSGYKDGNVYYSRCNFSNAFVHCVMIDYPADEERDWDDVVTRISLSLKAGR